jgi:hypothetical protein
MSRENILQSKLTSSIFHLVHYLYIRAKNGLRIEIFTAQICLHRNFHDVWTFNARVIPVFVKFYLYYNYIHLYGISAAVKIPYKYLVKTKFYKTGNSRPEWPNIMKCPV